MPDAVIEQGQFAVMAVQPEHIEAIRIWRNEQLDVVRQTAPITREQQVEYYEQCIWPTLGDRRPANILVTYLHCGRPIGYGGLVHIDWAESHAEVSFLLDPKYVEDEATYRAFHIPFLELIKVLAFEGLGFDYLTTETFPQRIAHMDDLESAGFLRDPQPPDSVLATGVRQDSVFHRCTRRRSEDKSE